MTITLSNVTSGYSGFQLSDITATIAKGSLTALIGPNGCGKSTLLKTITRHITKTRGQITIDGTDISPLSFKQLAQLISFLPQHPVVPAGITVEQLVGYGRAPYQNLFGLRSALDIAKTDEALELVSLNDLRNSLVTDLSGGQKQRAFIAMCVAQDTPYILLDEPTSFLDIRHQFEVLDLMYLLHRKGKTVVCVLHDVAQTARFASDVIVMKQGSLVQAGTPHDVITQDLVLDVYGIRANVYPDPITGTSVISPLPRD